MRCNCQVSRLEFTGWQPLEDAANVGSWGFGNVTSDPGVYCVRAAHCGETDPDKIIKAYRSSQLYSAFQAMADSSERFFKLCGLGPEWGWKWYTSYADKRLERIRLIDYDQRGGLTCPILYIGCSKSLQGRMRQLMDLEHTVNHPLWALLFSGWRLELAVRVANGHKEEEARLKQLYCEAHNERLPPLMGK
jgi:hypothetical protein